MKITVSKSEFYNRLKSLSRIIQPKNTLAAFDNFLFELKNGELHITAGDEGGSISTKINFTSDDLFEFSFMINAKTILDGLKEIPEQPIIFEVNEKYNMRCTYSSGKGKFEMQGEKGDTFPIIRIDKIDPLSITSSEFLYGLKQVQNCAADDELRPVLNGIYFDQDLDGITYASSNGMILGAARIEGKHHVRNGFIIPSRYSRILSNCIIGEGDIEIGTDDRNIFFSFEGYRMICRMIEGRYPNYRSVIPQNNHINILVSKFDIISALKRVSVFANKSSYLIALKGKENTNSISIIAQDLDFSLSADELIAVDSIKGGNIEIGLNANYFKEIVSLIPTDKVSLSFLDSTRAMIIRPDDSSDLTYIIMPLQINL